MRVEQRVKSDVGDKGENERGKTECARDANAHQRDFTVQE